MQKLEAVALLNFQGKLQTSKQSCISYLKECKKKNLAFEQKI